ncbi:MAG: PAS domain-containing protein [Firmicutes bacterium]|nr:PAS domain-containing protein [Bacillota bacterium]
MRKKIAEQFTKQMFNNAHLAIAVLDRKFNYLLVNETYAKLNERRQEDLLGINHLSLFSSETRQIFANVVATKKGYQVSAQAFYTDSKKDIKYWDWSLIPLLDEDEEVEALVIFLVDVTERVLAHQKIIQAKEHFEHIVESFSDPFLTLDRQWRCTYINTEALYLTYFTKRQDVLGKYFWDTFPHSTSEKFSQEYKLAMQTGQHRTFELYSSYTKKWLEVKIYPYQEGLAIFYNDITESKEAVQQLKESRERFRKLFDADPTMKCIINLKDKSLLAVNNALLRKLGYKRSELLGKPFWQKFSVAGCDMRNLKLLSIPSMKSNGSKKIKLHTKSGEIVYCLLFSEIIHFCGQYCLLCTMIDQTEQRRMELEIARLERLNLIGQMAGGLGHEIRNPMTTVHGFLQLLRSKKEYQQDKQCIEMMMSELEKANAIISEFLILSNKEVTQKAVSNINEIINSLQPLIETTALRQNKSVSFDLVAVPDVYVNEKEIRHVILNLVYNALDASDTVFIRSYCRGTTVAIDIIDHGHGIPADVLEKLGTPFLTTKENGTGLGLPVSFSIIQRHGGLIDVQTNSGGTTISIQLPALLNEMSLCL